MSRWSPFRERPPEGRYPYLWLDAKVEKVRGPLHGGCWRKALVIADAVHEVIALDVSATESAPYGVRP
jgi:putative transposase